MNTFFFFQLFWIMALELYGRDAIRSSKRISNPGCYSTSVQMLVAPLVNYIEPGVWPTVFGISGYSGAGTVAGTDPDGRPISIPKVDPSSLGGGVRPYSLTDHIHEREAGRHLSSLARPLSKWRSFRLWRRGSAELFRHFRFPSRKSSRLRRLRIYIGRGMTERGL